MVLRTRKARWISLAAMCSVAVVVGCSTWAFLHLPHPSEANRDELLKWLVLRDLAQEPTDIRIALVDRIEDELLQGIEVENRDGGLSDKYVERLSDNSTILQALWFHSRVREYGRQGDSQRVPYLERQINVVGAWSALQGKIYTWWGPTELTSAEYQAKSVVDFFDQIDAWVASAGDDREAMLLAVQDSVICWLANRDLAAQDELVRREFALRLATNLDGQGGLKTTRLTLDQDRQGRLKLNTRLLFAEWFREQAKEIDALEETERIAFVDRKIQQVTSWGILDLLADEQAEGGLLAMQTQFQVLVNQAPESEQPVLERAVKLLQTRMIVRQLKSIKLPLPKWMKPK